MNLQERFGDLRGRALWVVFGCLVCQFGLGYGYATNPFLKPISADLDITRTVWSSAGASRLWAMSFLSPLFGWLVVRFGARPILVVSCLMLAPSFYWLSRMTEVWELFGANLAVGLVLVGFGDVTLGAVVATWVTRGRGVALGIVYTGSNLAGAILLPLVTYLAGVSSWRQALLTVGVGGSLLILPFALWVARERRGTAALESIDAVDAAAEGDDDMDLRAAIRTRSFWVLGFALAGFFFYMVGVLDHFIASLTDRGLSSAEAGAYLGSAIGMGIFSKVVMGIVADRISPLPAIWTDYGLYAASSVVLIFVPDEPYLKAFVVLFGFSYAARDVVYPMAIAECFGVRYLAAIYGALMIVLAPAGSAGQIFAAHCFERFGSYDVAFEVFALVNVVVFASLFLLRPEKELARG